MGRVRVEKGVTSCFFDLFCVCLLFISLWFIGSPMGSQGDFMPLSESEKWCVNQALS